MNRHSPANPKLCREGIVDAAFTMIDEEGLDALSMRALGHRLGVSAMAVYGYFPSKEELLEAVGAKAMELIDSVPIPGERWDHTIMRSCKSMRRVMVEHPQIARLTLNMSSDSSAFEQHNRRVIGGHLAQGIPLEIFRKCWAIIDAYSFGFIAANVKELLTSHPASGSGGEEPWETIPESAYTEEAYENGLRLIIQGIRAEVAPDPCEWYTPME